MASYNCYLIGKNGQQIFYSDKPDLTKGDLFISVSQVLAMEGSGDFLIKWALREFGGRLDPIKAYDSYLERVSDLGSRLHKFIEYDLKGLAFPEAEFKEDMLPGVESWNAFKAQHKIKMIESERVVFSRKLRVAGTTDLVIEIDGVRYVADLKTGSVMDKAFTQLAAYKNMMQEMGIADGSERLLVLGGADSKSKIADGGKVIMHRLEDWFSTSVTEADLFSQFCCLRHLWYIKNIKSKKFEPVIKGMAQYLSPLVESFYQAFEIQQAKKGKKK